MFLWQKERHYTVAYTGKFKLIPPPVNNESSHTNAEK
jgi:hypothetical protein